MIIAGDFNIAHEEKDIFDKDTKVSFTEEEREVIDKIIDLGFSDAYRLFNDDVKYSSWKNNDAKEANEGSRVDYFFVSKSLKDNVKSSDILNNIKSSKHAPIILNLE
jgi:exodeoxyribonuclease-3